MEQNILPKKIKISVILMLATGFLALIQFVFIVAITTMAWSQTDVAHSSILSIILTNLEILVVAILFIVFAYFLKKRKRWAWFAAMVILLKGIVAGIKVVPLLFSIQIPELEYLMEYLPPPISTLFLIATIISILGYILILISFIFLISERKNYWQIAS